MQARRKLQNGSSNNNDLDRWNAIAREYDTVLTRGDFFRIHLLDPAMRELLGNVAGKHVLDAGCGQGYFAKECADKGARVTAIDGAGEFIMIAREHYHDTPHVTFSVHDLTTPLPFEDGVFDTVIANMVLMDIDPLAPTVREFGRVLKPEGALVFSILHPLFATGTLHKGLRERLARALPHYAITHYATPHKKPWHIPHTSHATAIYHRPLETYMRAFHDARLVLSDIREPVLTPEAVRGKPSAMQTLTEIPIFFIGRARKLPPRND